MSGSQARAWGETAGRRVKACGGHPSAKERLWEPGAARPGKAGFAGASGASTSPRLPSAGCRHAQAFGVYMLQSAWPDCARRVVRAAPGRLSAHSVCCRPSPLSHPSRCQHRPRRRCPGDGSARYRFFFCTFCRIGAELTLKCNMPPAIAHPPLCRVSSGEFPRVPLLGRPRTCRMRRTAPAAHLTLGSRAPKPIGQGGGGRLGEMGACRH